MSNLHLLHEEKFTEPYIEFVNKHFEQSEHKFFIIGTKPNTTITSRNNVVNLSDGVKNILKISKEIYQSNKIILHGLFIPEVIILLFFQPWLLKKCYWVIWGGDLYCYNNVRKTMKDKVKEVMRRFVIKRMGGVITHIKGDYELAQFWYGTKGKYYYSFLYTSNLFKEYDLSKADKSTGKTYILTGNSADPSNNHVEIFKKILKLNKENIEVICPLSYGDPNYANIVLNKGKELFGVKFNPLTNFLSFSEYLEILAKVDIAIFNHNRQQAVGNIMTLLSLGKKVYIRDDITTWDFCRDHGLKVYSINRKSQDIFESITNEIKKINKEKMKEQFSEEKLVSDWGNIFSSK